MFNEVLERSEGRQSQLHARDQHGSQRRLRQVGKGNPSNPTTEISCGTRNPASWIVPIAPIAVKSLDVMIAVGGFGNFNKFRIAILPPSMRWFPI